MNTLTLINRMRKVRVWYSLSAIEQALFYELVEICNMSGWKKQFSCSNSLLRQILGISDNKLTGCRRNLEKAGLITYTTAQAQRRPGTYSFIITPPVEIEREEDVSPSGKEETVVTTPVTTSPITPCTTSPGEDNIRYSIQKTKESIKERFDNFRKLYPGVKRGLDTEYKNFLRHADHAEVVDQLQPALQKLLHYRTMCKQAGVWIPDTLPHLRTWIHQRRWEEELNVQSIVNAYAEKQRTHQGPTIVP